MAIGTDETKADKETAKQWDVKTLDLPPVHYSMWGIKPGLIPEFVRLYGKEAIGDIKEGQEYLTLSFDKLKKIVAFLHVKGHNAPNLTEALEQAINHRKGEEHKKLVKGNDKEGKPILSEKELYTHLQHTLYSFMSPNPPFHIRIDGHWGPQSQGALEQVLQSYHLPLQQPSEDVLEQLQVLSSRIVRLQCTDSSVINAVPHDRFCIIHREGKAFALSPKERGGILVRLRDRANLMHFPLLLRKSKDQPALFSGFSGWLMLLCMKAENPYEKFCDLWVRTDEADEWTIPIQPSPQAAEQFVIEPDVVLSYTKPRGANVSVKFIGKGKFDIEIIGVYFSAQLSAEFTHGTQVRNQLEAGHEFLYTRHLLFAHPDETINAWCQPLVQANFFKLFIVRKNRDIPHLTEYSKDMDGGPVEFYQLMATKPKDLLATITIGLYPATAPGKPNLAVFKKMVEQRYSNTKIIVHDDLQKDRWGGLSQNNGRVLTCAVEPSAVPGFYTLSAEVKAAGDGSPLQGHVAFFLHDSFPNEIEFVKVKNGVARLKIPLCYEAFTLASYTEDDITLELDMNELPGYPKGFYWKKASNFQDRVRKLYDSKPVRVKDDLQKDRWGGSSEVNGKMLTAMVSASWEPGFYNVQMQIGFDDPEQGGEAAFFLHNSFGREIRFVPIKDGAAGLKVKAYEAFTVGAYTDDGTEMELNLNEVLGYPEGFYYADPQNDDKGFYTESGINNLVRKQLKGTSEYVECQLLFFKTEQQRTWLVLTTRNVYVLLDDRDTREVGKVIQTSFERSKTLPLKFRKANSNEKEMVVQFAAQDTWWYFSRNLFGKDQDLVRAVEELVTSKNFGLHNITAYVAGLTFKTPAKAFPASRKVALDEGPSKEGKEQVVISGRSIVCFVREISSSARQDVLNSMILAQFSADKTSPIEKDTALWYKKYTDVLGKLGWIVQNGNLNDFKANQNIFEMQKDVLEILSLRFGINRIGLINKTIAKLTQLLVEEDTIVMTFGKNIQSSSKACAQVVLVTEERGRVVAECVTWFVASKNRIPKLIAGDFEGEELRISYVSGQISLGAQFDSVVRKSIQDKLNYWIADYTANIEL